MKLMEMIDTYIIEVREKTDLDKRTRDCEKSFFLRYIVPVIHDMNAEDFNLEVMKTILRRAHRMGRGMDTGIRIMKLIHNSYTYANQSGTFAGEPVDLESLRNQLLIECMMYSADEISRVSSSIDMLTFDNVYRLVLETGFSRQEVCAISIEDFYDEEGIVYINKLLKGVENDGSPILEYIEKGRTDRKLNETAIICIRSEIRRMTANKSRAGEKWNNPENLVFTDSFGNALGSEVFRKDNEKLRLYSGIPYLTLDDMRQVGVDRMRLNMPFGGDDLNQ